MFSGCQTTEHRIWTLGSTETIERIDDFGEDWEDCSNLCADWVGPQDEICVFWQHDKYGACLLKRGVTCDQPQVDTNYHSLWNIGQCDPPSDSTCEEGKRIGENNHSN